MLLTILLGVCAKCNNGKDSHFCSVGQSFQGRNRIKTELKNQHQKFGPGGVNGRAGVVLTGVFIFFFGRGGGTVSKPILTLRTIRPVECVLVVCTLDKKKEED